MCSLAKVAPRSLAVLGPSVGHTMHILSPFISVLCHSDWLLHGESCPYLDVVVPGRARSFSPGCMCGFKQFCCLHCRTWAVPRTPSASGCFSSVKSFASAAWTSRMSSPRNRRRACAGRSELPPSSWRSCFVVEPTRTRKNSRSSRFYSELCLFLVVVLKNDAMKDVSSITCVLEVGRQEGQPACRKLSVVGCWRSYLPGARCRLAYGPADATATHCLLLQ